MMKVSRQLMVVGNKTRLQPAIQKLSYYGWSVQHPETLQEALVLHRKKTCKVGLVMLDENSSSFPIEIEPTPGLSDIQWVAVVDDAALLSDKARDLIFNVCFAYHSGPIDPQRVNTLLESALAMAGLLESRHNPTIAYQEDGYCVVGDTPVMRQLYRTIHKVASVDAPVLITGESGTGKELTARAIHDHSSRRHGPFSAVNCGALPAGLIQSELFGHEKGAFTGANQRKIGIIENTKDGTLFLDEIGDLPLDMQANLLRFLENLKVLRVGGLQEIPIDVRVLAATHVDLEKAVEKGEFREDLYHRLNVLQVQTPALREHPEDIEPLAHFFFKKFSSEKPSKVRGFSRESTIVMRQHPWSGNIRELLNRVRRSMVMCEHRLITPSDMGLERRNGNSRGPDTLQQVRDMAECEAITAALARNKYKVLHAARELGVSRVTLYRLIDKHYINKNGGSHDEEPARPSTSGFIRLTST